MRKKLIVILTACLAASVIMFTACDFEDYEFDAVLKNSPVNVVLLGDLIDLDDYVVWVRLPKVNNKISVKWNSQAEGRDIIKTINGEVFAPLEPAVYEFTFTVSAGSKQKSNSFTIEVLGSVPQITVDKSPLVYNLGDTVNINVLLQRANPMVAPPSADIEILSITYKQIEFDVQGEREVLSENLPLGSNILNFNRAGDYIFEFKAESEGLFSTETFIVTVIDQHNIPEEFENKSYKAEFADDNIVRLLRSSDRTRLGYAVLGDYNEGTEIEIEFYGKNLPQIGFLCSEPQVIEPNSHGVFKGSGYVLSFEYSSRMRYQLYGPNKFSGSAVKVGMEGREDYFGFDDLDPDTHYILRASLEKQTGGGNITWRFYTLDEGRNETLVREWVKSAFGANVPNSGLIILYGSALQNIIFRYNIDEVKEGDPYDVLYYNESLYRGYIDQNRKITLQKSFVEGASMGAVTATDFAYIALGGDYGGDTLITVEFKGKNRPNLALFTDNITHDLISGFQGAYIGDFNTPSYLQRITVFNIFSLTDGNLPSAIRPVTFSPTTDHPASYNMLEADVNYIYIIKIVTGNDNIKLFLTLKNADNDEQIYSNYVTFFLNGNYTGTDIGNIIFYGSMQDDITFSYNVSSGSDLPYRRVMLQRDISGTEYAQSSFTVLDGEYQNGAYIMTEFTGQILPSIAFFGNNYTKNMKSGQKAMFISNDFTTGDLRLFPHLNNTTGDIINSVSEHIKFASLNPANTYIFIAGVVLRPNDEGIKVTFELYQKGVDGKITLIESVVRERADLPNAAAGFGTKIALYGSRHANTTYKIYQPAQTLEQLLGLFEITNN